MVKRAEIRRYARSVGQRFHAQRVILFGSYARGSAIEESDVDLLVVMDHDKPRNIDQALAIRLERDASFPMDLLVKRPSEVSARVARENGFIRGIIEDGEVLYE